MKSSFIQAAKRKGFTLVEAMVAISILSLAITGPLVIAQKGIASAIYARDQITAFYLAQEAVEYVRDVRDTNRITKSAWLNGLSSCVDNGGGQRCTIDVRTSTVAACPSNICTQISFDPATGFYGYGAGAGNASQFTRTVSIDSRGDTTNSPAKEAVISVSISWNTTLFSPPRVFTIKEYIFNF
jgi:prepilin-type N-terminal cleavage/methylation domain-containing protein